MRRAQRRRWSARLSSTPARTLVISGVFLLSGYEAIQGLFRAGVWMGMTAIVAVVALGAALAAMLRKESPQS